MRSSIPLQFVLTGLVWGSSFLFIAVGLTGMTPAQVVYSRVVFGALALGVIVLLRRERLPRRVVVWAHLTVVAVMFCIAPYLLFAWAQQHVASGLASIFNATTPLMTAVMAWLVFRVERLGAAQLAGIAVGIAGVIVIIAPGAGAEASSGVVAQLALLGATACYGFGLAYIRRFLPGSELSATAMAFCYIGIAAVVMLVLTPVVFAEPVRWSAPVLASVAALGILGTALAYVWNQNTLRAWGPTRASTVTYLTPIVGVVLGIVVLGERLSWNQPVGAVVVVVGILLTQGRLRLPRARG